MIECYKEDGFNTVHEWVEKKGVKKMKMKIVYDEILKHVLKDERIIIGELGDKIFVSPDGFKIYIVPANKFFLDVEKILHGAPKSQFDLLIKHEHDAKQISMTNEIRKVERMMVVKIGEIWVNMKNLKAFENPQFASTVSRRSPIYIYENSELVGITLPVTIKEDEEVR